MTHEDDQMIAEIFEVCRICGSEESEEACLKSIPVFVRMKDGREFNIMISQCELESGHWRWP